MKRMMTMGPLSAASIIAFAAAGETGAGAVADATANISTGDEREDLTDEQKAALAEQTAAEAQPADAGTATAAPKPVSPNARRFTDEQITEMRALRAERHPEGHDKAGQPVWSHAKLAAKFDTKAGVVSHIVRNLTYKDPNYTPTNDGK